MGSRLTASGTEGVYVGANERVIICCRTNSSRPKTWRDEPKLNTKPLELA